MNEICMAIAILCIPEEQRTDGEKKDLEAFKLLLARRGRASVGYALTTRGKALLSGK